MSQRALLLSVRNRLRDTVANGGLAYANAECEVMFDGQPPPNAPERFIAVHAGTWTARGDTEGLDETYGIMVTVTVRTAKSPIDKTAPNLLVGSTGGQLDVLLEAIRAKLHKDPGPRSSTDTSQYPVLAVANTTIGASDNGFVEPLVFTDGGQPEAKGPDWFHADSDNWSGSIRHVGIAQTLTFGGARRIQVIEEQG